MYILKNKFGVFYVENNNKDKMAPTLTAFQRFTFITQRNPSAVLSNKSTVAKRTL